MKLGICTSIANIEKAIDIGFDYVVLSGTEVSSLNADQFIDLTDIVLKRNIDVSAFNGLCPSNIDIAGPNYSNEKARDYIRKLAERGKELGVRSLGIGAPNSRKIPKGFDRKKAWDNGRKFIEIAAEETSKYGMTVSIEELTFKYCNFINTLEESRLMSTELEDYNIPIIIDFFHLEADGHEPEYAEDYIKYAYDVHVSGIDKTEGVPRRPFLNERDYDRLTKIADVLRENNYNKTVTLEPDPVDYGFEEKAIESLKQLRRVFWNTNDKYICKLTDKWERNWKWELVLVA